MGRSRPRQRGSSMAPSSRSPLREPGGRLSSPGRNGHVLSAALGYPPPAPMRSSLPPKSQRVCRGTATTSQRFIHRSGRRAHRASKEKGRQAVTDARIDPVTFEVIRNALVAATDEMVVTLRRSAYSTNIKTRSDFSCAFFDADLRSVAQGFTQPVHLGSMSEQIPRAVRDYGAENLVPGDVLITNDPFPSGVHLNDVSLISPVHHEGAL